MDYTGLVSKFKNNRPLSDFERKHHLKQETQLDIPLLAQLCVVKMDSNILVSVDRWFGWRGFCALIGLIGVIIGGYGVIYFISIIFTDDISNNNGLLVSVFICITMFVGLTGIGFWLTSKEMFCWTYYPIILDRKNRKLHVFRLNGTIMTESWDNVYFTIGRTKGAFGILYWDVRGLLFYEDGVTIRETFSFSIVTGNIENAYSHWEFLRRYMEFGPQSVLDVVLFCMPVDGKRESFAVSKERIFANDAHGPSFIYLTMIPFNYVHAVVRWAVMQTSKIPIFPLEIEVTFRPDPDDKYTRDATMNPEDLS
ncbi:DUF6708 domain-containing protein [Serratia quinivorans]|uniref:DUF6708 domain-containing protein n=1 Tax=Serratia quinivorans TaxID=137545 RepID=UPI0034C61657